MSSDTSSRNPGRGQRARAEDADHEADEDAEESGPAGGFRNYITPAGYKRLNAELARLWEEERPRLVETVAWAASNGDRSENGDYIYGKRRLREIDRRIRFLSKRLDSAQVVDNTGRKHAAVFFGATVTIADESGEERRISIVGVDELDPANGRVSWISPIAKALRKAEVGDVVTLVTPRGKEQIEVLEICYDDLP